MIERYIYTALQASFELFAKRPTMFDSLFGQLYELGPREVTAIKAAFAKKFPVLEHAYSPDAAQMPCYTLVNGSESQAQSMLANTAGVMAPLNSSQPQALFSNIWSHQYTLLCYAQNKDLAHYMYEVAKASLYLQIEYLLRHNIYELQLTGQPMTLDEREPDRMFYRALGITCSREFRFFADNAEPRLFKVDGLFVHDNRDAEKGGVSATIQTTTQPQKGT
jgi:hypothetical protein